MKRNYLMLCLLFFCVLQFHNNNAIYHKTNSIFWKRHMISRFRFCVSVADFRQRIRARINFLMGVFTQKNDPHQKCEWQSTKHKAHTILIVNPTQFFPHQTEIFHTWYIYMTWGLDSPLMTVVLERELWRHDLEKADLHAAQMYFQTATYYVISWTN